MVRKVCLWVLISLAVVAAVGCAAQPSVTAAQVSPAVITAQPAHPEPTTTFAPDTAQIYLTPGAPYGNSSLTVGNVFIDSTSVTVDSKIGMSVLLSLIHI